MKLSTLVNYPHLVYRRQLALERSGLPCSSTILAEARLVRMEIRFIILTSVEVCISEGVTSLRPVGTTMHHSHWCHSPFYEDVNIAPVIINHHLVYKDYKCRGTGHTKYGMSCAKDKTMHLCPEEDIACLFTEVKRLKPSATLSINEQIVKKREKGEHVLHMGFGESSFPVHPIFRDVLAKNADKKSYQPTQGILPLREGISAFYKTTFLI